VYTTTTPCACRTRLAAPPCIIRAHFIYPGDPSTHNTLYNTTHNYLSSLTFSPSLRVSWLFVCDPHPLHLCYPAPLHPPVPGRPRAYTRPTRAWFCACAPPPTQGGRPRRPPSASGARRPDACPHPLLSRRARPINLVPARLTYSSLYPPHASLTLHFTLPDARYATHLLVIMTYLLCMYGPLAAPPSKTMSPVVSPRDLERCFLFCLCAKCLEIVGFTMMAS